MAADSVSVAECHVTPSGRSSDLDAQDGFDGKTEEEISAADMVQPGAAVPGLP